jgi:hypothetical protein
VDLHGLLGLNDPIGFFFCLAGFAAQLWITRKNKLFFAINSILVLILLATFGAVAEYWFPRFRRHIPDQMWVGALIQLWCLSILAVAVTLETRNRVIPYSESRRRFFQASTAAICAVPATVVSFGIISRKDFDVNEVDLKLPRLPRDLQNLRIVQLSDIHLGEFYSERDLARVVDAANGLRGDLAIVTGDLITGPRDPLRLCLRQLSRLKSASGIWGCMGNHEYFAGLEDAAAEIGSNLGVNFLRWQAKSLRFGGSSLNLVGVDYQSPRSPYLVDAEELVEAGQFNLLLSHNPDVFPVATDKGFDLVLAGHTHGGQINVEIFDKNLNIASFFTPYTRGLYTGPTSAIYVNSGIGTIGMPIRIGAPPEISLIKLCAS